MNGSTIRESKTMAVVVAVCLLSFSTFVAASWAGPTQAESCRALPEFTQRSPSAWLNSAPLERNSLRGSVALVDIWTFACWNCYRSFPWLKQVETRYNSRGLRVIGIHSPEFDYEKKRESVAVHVRKHNLAHPVMLDNDHAYWRALGNSYWPAFYLVDRKGCIRDTFVGETHSNTNAARNIESAIERLLAEK